MDDLSFSADPIYKAKDTAKHLLRCLSFMREFYPLKKLLLLFGKDKNQLFLSSTQLSLRTVG
jgi:hypothetical protein